MDKLQQCELIWRQRLGLLQNIKSVEVWFLAPTETVSYLRHIMVHLCAGTDSTFAYHREL